MDKENVKQNAKPVAVLEREMRSNILSAIENSGLHISFAYYILKEVTEYVRNRANLVKESEISTYEQLCETMNSDSE